MNPSDGCAAFQDLAFDYLEGSLGRGELDGFRSHFTACASCSEMLRTIEGHAELLAALPRPVPPRTLGSRIEDAVADRVALRRRRVYPLRWMAAAAALLVWLGLAQLRSAAPRRPEPARVVRVVEIQAPESGTVMGHLTPSYDNPGASLLDPFVPGDRP